MNGKGNYMQIWDREKACLVKEDEYQKELLEFLYHTLLGRILLKVISQRWFSKMNALRYKSIISKRKIKPFIKKYKIDICDCTRIDFKSFDDFFTRQRNYRIQNTDVRDLISISDARLSCYDISSDLTLRIKNSIYTIKELVGNSNQLQSFQNGKCLVYRLAVDDYHRYVFLDGGSIGEITSIKGVLHTVRPVSDKYRVYSHNNRVCTLLHTVHFGDVMQIEVGALTVGKINNYQVEKFERLQEKGFFSYGGSTIILLFQQNIIKLDEDIRKEHRWNRSKS